MAAAIMSVKQVCGRVCLQEIIRNLQSTCRRDSTWSFGSPDISQQTSYDALLVIEEVRRYLPTQATSGGATQPEQQEPTEGKKDKWLSNFFVRRIDTGHESHSSRLSDKDIIYELQIHKVKPEFMNSYLKITGEFVDKMNTKETGRELVGSWTVDIGDQDEAIHIWRYPGGYPQLSAVTNIYRTDKDFVEFRNNRNKMLRSRRNQILLAFAFWGGIKPRSGNNIYELRSYTLKPGTMIEWGNYWAKGIKCRQDYDEATAGFFSHIGDLSVIYHLWSYANLDMRQEVRDHVWEKPGWDVCVQHTVPLIRHMTSRILVPTPFSPLK